jgi:hypothetical protein
LGLGVLVVVVGACSGQSVVSESKSDADLCVLKVRERSSVIQIQLAISLVVMGIDFKGDGIADALKESHAVRMLQDWQDGTTTDEYSLIIVVCF